MQKDISDYVPTSETDISLRYSKMVAHYIHHGGRDPLN